MPFKLINLSRASGAVYSYKTDADTLAVVGSDGYFSDPRVGFVGGELIGVDASDGSDMFVADGEGNAVTQTMGLKKYTNVRALGDLPDPVGSVITLLGDHTYYFVGSIDLLGSRLVCGSNTCILGPSSENAFITSTGLGAGVPLLYSEWTAPIRHVTFKDVDTAFEIQGAANAPVALDWTGVNFSTVPNVGLINTADNFIFTKGAFLSSENLRLSGTIGTVSIADSLLQGSGAANALIVGEAGLTITRRIRLIYSSLIALGSTTGLNISASATLPDEAFILDTINFSGGGDYLPGIDSASNKSLFSKCVGITNTAINGQMYMTDNATATTVSSPSTFYKVAGATSASTDNRKYDHASNRLTNRAAVERKYLLMCQLSFNAGANNSCEFGFYDSKLGAMRTPSRTKGTANTAGRLENMGLSCVVQHADGDYLELHAANLTGTVDITVDSMNMVVVEI